MSEGADSSTASGDAGTSSPQDVIDATEEEGASAQKAVRVKEPAPVYDLRGEEYSVPQETIDAIESFQVPADYQQKGAREE